MHWLQAEQQLDVAVALGAVAAAGAHPVPFPTAKQLP